MSFDPNMGIPDEVTKAAEEMSSTDFNLKVPDGVQRKNQYYARWTEYVVIERAVCEPNEEKGRLQYQVKYKVLPLDESSPNAGRTFVEFMNYNPGEAAAIAPGTEFAAMTGEQKMSVMTAGKLKQFAVAAKLPAALTAATLNGLFPRGDVESALNGMKFVFTVLDNSNPKKQFNGKNSQGIDAVAPAPEGA